MLCWNHDWGAKAQYWNDRIAEGRPAPEPFYNRPDVLPWAEFYWIAFNHLATERSIGMGIGPIPYSKAIAYARDSGVDDPDQIDRFWEIVHAVDNEDCKIRNSATPDKQAANKVQPDEASPEPRKRVAVPRKKSRK